MKMPSLTSFSFVIIAATLSTSALAGDCSRDEIDHFLDRGFTPEQVVQLCGNTAPVVAPPVITTPAVAPPIVTTPAIVSTPTIATSSPKAMNDPSEITQDEWFTLKNAIEADKVFLEGDKLIYERDRCHEFGTEGFTGFKEEACVVTRTQIGLNGLQVSSAKNGVFIIIEGELVVKSDIQREILNIDILRSGVQKRFLEEYSLQPSSLDIPLKNGFKHTAIAKILNKLAQ